MALQGTSNHLVWPSAFQWIEKPLYDLNEARNNGVKFSNKELAKQYVYWPIVMCLTPVTCLADVAAGIAESAFSVYQGEGLSRMPSILHKKIIASPLQHAIFFGSNMLVPVMFGLMMTLSNIKVVNYVNEYNQIVRTATKWDFAGCYKACIVISTVLFGPPLGFLGYHLAQIAVGKLSDWAHPEGFNIFINGGCVNHNGRKLTDSDYAEKDYQDYVKQRFKEAFEKRMQDPVQREKYNEHARQHGFSEYTPNAPQVSIASWADFIKPLQDQIPVNNKPADKLDEFEKFSKAIKEGKSSQQCLGLPNKPTLEEIKIAYRKWALVLHPDRNRNRQALADTLTKALLEARMLLENQLKK